MLQKRGGKRMCVLDGKVALVTGASKGIGAGIQSHRQLRPAGPNRLPDALSLRRSIFLAKKPSNQFAKRSDKMGKSMKAMRVARKMSQSFCIVLLLLTCGALSAQNREQRIRNIVLVHGAWADGAGRRDVSETLVKDGYKVSVVQVPETFFKHDVAATKRI